MTTEEVPLPDPGSIVPTVAESYPELAGRYKLETRIAAGGMGVVWRATDLLLARTVAVKQLLLATHLDEAAAEEARARAAREARIAARLHHPAAVAVFDIVEEGGNPWLVMEYLPSRNLADVIAEHGKLPPLQVARIGAQLAGALAAAHAAGIVHRDVKPANVLLGDDGTVKITDFGVSRAAWEVAVTQTGMVAGTPAYLAPEVAQGREPTAAADVFALGSTLYAAVEGEPPFGLGDNPLALLRTVADGEVAEPRWAGPLAAPLQALLAADPEDRPSAATAASMLAAVAADAPRAGSSTLPHIAVVAPHAATPAAPEATTVLEPAVRPVRAERPWWRRRVLVGVLAACLVILAGLVVVPMLTGPDDKAAATRAPVFDTPPATPAEVRATVQEFYAALPDDTDTAWSRLGETERARVGGPAAFERSWSTVTYVNPTSDIVVDGYFARLDVLFERSDGTATIEPFEFVVRSSPTGNPIIESITATGPARPVAFQDRANAASSSRVDDRTDSTVQDTGSPEPAPDPASDSPSPPSATETSPAPPSQPAPSSGAPQPIIEEPPADTGQVPSTGSGTIVPNTDGAANDI